MGFSAKLGSLKDNVVKLFNRDKNKTSLKEEILFPDISKVVKLMFSTREFPMEVIFSLKRDLSCYNFSKIFIV